MSKVQLAGNASGTGIFTIASPNSNTDRTQTLPDASGTLLNTGSTAVVTQAMLASNVAGNGPAFSAYLPTTNQSVSVNTSVKVALSAESFDTASCFNNTGSSVGGIPAYAFMPNVAGYYQFTGQITFNGSSLVGGVTLIFKNGSVVAQNQVFSSFTNSVKLTASTLLYMNGTTDYVELYGYNASSSAAVFEYAVGNTFFTGALVRAA